jgi:hypothetical protein
MEHEMEESGSNRSFSRIYLPPIDSPYFEPVSAEAAHPGVLLGSVKA